MRQNNALRKEKKKRQKAHQKEKMRQNNALNKEKKKRQNAHRKEK